MEKASVPDHEIADLRLNILYQRMDRVIRFVLTYCPGYSEELIRVAITTGKGPGSKQIWSFLGQVLDRDVELLKAQLLTEPEPHEVVGSNYFRRIVTEAFERGGVEELAQICERYKISNIREARSALMGGQGDKAKKIITQLADAISMTPTQFRDQFRTNKYKPKKTEKISEHSH